MRALLYQMENQFHDRARNDGDDEIVIDGKRNELDPCGGQCAENDHSRHEADPGLSEKKSRRYGGKNKSSRTLQALAPDLDLSVPLSHGGRGHVAEGKKTDRGRRNCCRIEEEGQTDAEDIGGGARKFMLLARTDKTSEPGEYETVH